MAEFKPGDHVRAKHVKGPDMIVNGINGNHVRCVWFVAQKMNSEQFHMDALEHVPAGSTPA